MVRRGVSWCFVGHVTRGPLSWLEEGTRPAGVDLGDARGRTHKDLENHAVLPKDDASLKFSPRSYCATMALKQSQIASSRNQTYSEKHADVRAGGLRG